MNFVQRDVHFMQGDGRVIERDVHLMQRDGLLMLRDVLLMKRDVSIIETGKDFIQTCVPLMLTDVKPGQRDTNFMLRDFGFGWADLPIYI